MDYLVAAKRMAAGLALVGAVVGVPTAHAQPSPFCQSGSGPAFVFGFADLKASVGDPMGDPIECEHANPANGDTLQKTSTGLSFYRKATNTPTFTDGFNHWALTSEGLVTWTGASIDPPGTAVAPSSNCPTPPIRGFGNVWSNNDEVRSLMNCPAGQEQAADVTAQQFENGWMLRIPPAAANQPARIYALFNDGQDYASFPDTWSQAADPVSTGLNAPAGLLEPERGFGKVWREGTGAHVRDRLGWATSPEQTGSGARQSFRGGQMVFAPGPRLIFVLTNAAGSAELWRVFPDTYSG
ncbi:MAG: hypothetical protein JO352_23805 [Chloroflexi bacterium]|nr:hypothetical protein [Chloroflexota bacterium]MBV9596959.1 hypothetical protein [Chloroflexota bacterium]